MGTVFPKKIFPVQNKNNNYQQIPHIRVSLGTKFRLKQTISHFLTKFDQKGDSGLKQKSEHEHQIKHIPTNLSTMLYFQQFQFFGPNLLKKGYFQSKTEKVSSSPKFNIFQFA